MTGHNDGYSASGASINGNSNLLVELARFSNNQFLDTVSLLAALSTKLKAAGGQYAEVDHTTEAEVRRV